MKELLIDPLYLPELPRSVDKNFQTRQGTPILFSEWKLDIKIFFVEIFNPYSGGKLKELFFTNYICHWTILYY
jgi:hypothetical protein